MLNVLAIYRKLARESRKPKYNLSHTALMNRSISQLIHSLNQEFRARGEGLLFHCMVSGENLWLRPAEFPIAVQGQPSRSS